MFLSNKNQLLNEKEYILNSDIADHYCTILSLNTNERKYYNNNKSYQAFTKLNYSYLKQLVLSENRHVVIIFDADKSSEFLRETLNVCK